MTVSLPLVSPRSGRWGAVWEAEGCVRVAARLKQTLPLSGWAARGGGCGPGALRGLGCGARLCGPAGTRTSTWGLKLPPNAAARAVHAGAATSADPAAGVPPAALVLGSPDPRGGGAGRTGGASGLPRGPGPSAGARRGLLLSGSGGESLLATAPSSWVLQSVRAPGCAPAGAAARGQGGCYRFYIFNFN